ncbi:hypothetical protein [Leptospira borgpetersenii]|uniref:hypothetical protein n=1 Tax=Leptospira borgpetersenii TaxID=174 RepID=UPI000AD199B1|nr:hypothetical protein [Leptospira borgpetersenii]
MELKNDINVGLRKENFWSTINKTKGFEREFWIGEVQVSADMDNVVFLNTYTPLKNFEAEGFNGFFTKDSLVLTFDFDRFRNWSEEGSSPEKMLKALDAVLATFEIGIKDWNQVLDKEVTYNLKVLLSLKNERHFFELVGNIRCNDDDESSENDENCYRTYSYSSFLEFRRKEVGSIIHVRFKKTYLDCYQDRVLGTPFWLLEPYNAEFNLNAELNRFFQSIGTVGTESEWFKAMEFVSNLKSDESVNNVIRKINSIELSSPALPNYYSDAMYEEFVGEPFHSVLKKSTNWLFESGKMKFEIQQTVRFLKRHERIIRELQKQFEIREVEKPKEKLY